MSTPPTWITIRGRLSWRYNAIRDWPRRGLCRRDHITIFRCSAERWRYRHSRQCVDRIKELVLTGAATFPVSSGAGIARCGEISGRPVLSAFNARRTTSYPNHGIPRSSVYLPGIHGDWSMIGDFRRHVLLTTVSWSLPIPGPNLDPSAIWAGGSGHVGKNKITHGWIIGESFGSQVLKLDCNVPSESSEGVILSGGFSPEPERHHALGKNFRLPRETVSLLRSSAATF